MIKSIKRHTSDGIERGALAQGVYRYWLTRVWDNKAPRALFVMLNPSTADDMRDDLTITKCISFAREWGFGSIEVVNLFAYRATESDILKNFSGDRTGPENHKYIHRALKRADEVILAWGNDARTIPVAKNIADLLLGFPGTYYSLGCTKEHQPRHPSRLSYSTTRIPVAIHIRNSKVCVQVKTSDNHSALS